MEVSHSATHFFIGRAWLPGLLEAMNIISWNGCGLGNVKAIPEIKDLVRVYKPDIVILIETLVNGNKISDLCYSIGFDNHFSVDRIGRSGGLAILWRNSVDCSLINFSQNFINLLIKDPVIGSCRLTTFYGYSDSGRRRESWDLLRHLGNLSNDPWCIIGDFNDHLSFEDKRGGPDRPSWLIRGFQDVVKDCILFDMPLHGYQFTWFKSIGTPSSKEARIDHALVTSSWQTLYPNTALQTLVASISDHTPLLLQLDPIPWRQPHRSFRFNNSWLLEPELNQLVKSNWAHYPPSNILTKLNHCIEDISSWSRNITPNFRQQINKQCSEIEDFWNSSDDASDPRLATMQSKLASLLLQEESYWKQRSKIIFWLADGDTNNKFFHASTSARKRKNMVNKLLDNSGNWVTSHEDLCTLVHNYFTSLFRVQQGDLHPIISCVQPRISDEDNSMLTQQFTMQEFKEAIFNMHPDKSPGPDGLNPTFYHIFWEDIGDEIFSSASSWLASSYLPPDLNATNIVLAPKGDNLESMRDLRPISLCNVLYKIVPKVLANRLRPLINKWISQEQAAFVHSRSIMANALTTFEVLHHMRCKTKEKIGEVALKLDISKAFDSVSSSYLKAILFKMGFSSQWTSWMMICITSVENRVIFNGDRIGPITPERGLHQGCPLSPYLYILCAKGLSAAIKNRELRGKIHDTRICRTSPPISHLLFADDSFLFCKATMAEAQHLKETLSHYEHASGQTINYGKSAIAFNSNTHHDTVADIRSLLGVFAEIGSGKYLGLPSMIGRSNKAIFSCLKDRI